PEQCRRRAAQHLDVIDLAKLEIRELPLTVGERLGNTVDQNLDAANAKHGSRAEAANRDALILGEVVAVRDKDPRHGHQRFIESPGRTGAADGTAVDALNR